MISNNNIGATLTDLDNVNFAKILAIKSITAKIV